MLNPGLFLARFWLNMFPMLMDTVPKHVINMQVDKWSTGLYEVMWNAILMQQGNFIDVVCFLLGISPASEF